MKKKKTTRKKRASIPKARKTSHKKCTSRRNKAIQKTSGKAKMKKTIATLRKGLRELEKEVNRK